MKSTGPAERLETLWSLNKISRGTERPYSAQDVLDLRGSVEISHTLAEVGCATLRKLFSSGGYVASLSAVTGCHAVQHASAGLKAVYASGWQVAADANGAMSMYPDQSLYPSDSMPKLVRRLNNAMRRADQIHKLRGHRGNWILPIVADAEAGFGGPLHAFELMTALIESGASGVHFEDQLASVKKCGHLGGKVLVPTREFITKLTAARLAADVCGVDTVLIARTDADAATLLTSNVDDYDAPFIIDKDRTHEGFYHVTGGLEAAIHRAIAYAPYADVLWSETSTPDIGKAREFAQAIHEKFPKKQLAYNCSPSFNWSCMPSREIREFQDKLGELGYVFQFVTLSGFHSLNLSMHELATSYRESGMIAYSDLQDHEIMASEGKSYEALKHQSFVGVEYFDRVTEISTGGLSSTKAMAGSTEEEQF